MLVSSVAPIISHYSLFTVLLVTQFYKSHSEALQVALVGSGCSPPAVSGPITKLVHREDTVRRWGGVGGGVEAAAASYNTGP